MLARSGLYLRRSFLGYRDRKSIISGLDRLFGITLTGYYSPLTRITQLDIIFRYWHLSFPGSFKYVKIASSISVAENFMRSWIKERLTFISLHHQFAFLALVAFLPQESLKDFVIISSHFSYILWWGLLLSMRERILKEIDHGSIKFFSLIYIDREVILVQTLFK